MTNTRLLPGWLCVGSAPASTVRAEAVEKRVGVKETKSSVLDLFRPRKGLKMEYRKNEINILCFHAHQYDRSPYIFVRVPADYSLLSALNKYTAGHEEVIASLLLTDTSSCPSVYLLSSDTKIHHTPAVIAQRL